jgi:hypothetical protein
MREARASMPRTLVEGVRIALDEMFEAFMESINTLTTDQLWSHPIEKRHSIGVIAMHVQENIDQHACFLQVGRYALAHDERFAIYGKPIGDFLEIERPPLAEELRQRNETLKQAVLETLDGVEDAELYTPRFGGQTYWWQQYQRTSIDAYHRVVWHANSHVRQIWCLRGAMGAFGPATFPRQFWH